MPQNPYASPRGGIQPGHHGAPVSLVTPRVLLATVRCRPWLFLLSVACFAVLAVEAVSLLVAEGEYDAKGVWVAASLDTGSLVVQAIVGMIQLLCGIFFWNFGRALGKLGSSRNENDLMAALRAELGLLRVVGITALVYVILLAMGIAGGLALSKSALDSGGDPAEEELE